MNSSYKHLFNKIEEARQRHFRRATWKKTKPLPGQTEPGLKKTSLPSEEWERVRRRLARSTMSARKRIAGRTKQQVESPKGPSTVEKGQIEHAVAALSSGVKRAKRVGSKPSTRVNLKSKPSVQPIEVTMAKQRRSAAEIIKGVKSKKVKTVKQAVEKEGSRAFTRGTGEVESGGHTLRV